MTLEQKYQKLLKFVNSLRTISQLPSMSDSDIDKGKFIARMEIGAAAVRLMDEMEENSRDYLLCEHDA